MDIYCPRCGEPTDLDSLHEETEDRLMPGQRYDEIFKEVQADFRKRGCEALKCSHGDMGKIGQERAWATAALMELMPDDFDGVASMLEDAGY